MAAAMLTLTSCGFDYDGQIDNQVILNFTPLAYESMETKATVQISEVSNYLDVWLIDGETILEAHQSKAADATTFGSIPFTLNKTKTYTVVAVAHKGNGAATLEESVISFPDNKITETFFYTGAYCPGTGGTTPSFGMTRNVGMFKLTFTDALPAALEKVQFTVTGSGLGYNIAGYSTNVGDKTSVINNPSSSNDGTTSFKIYCLADGEASTISVTVTAYGDEDAVIETKTFEDVPLRAGYIASYRGTFFVTTAATAGFTADDAWENYEQESF